MVTLVVIRVVYVNDVAVSISVPCDPFTGDTATIDASAYVRKHVVCPTNANVKNRTEYHVVPSGSSEGHGTARLDRWSSVPPAPPVEEPANEDRSGIRPRTRITHRLRRVGR